MNLVRKAVSLVNRILTPARAEHARRVASLLPNPTQEEVAAAYLHDVLEDTNYKISDLRKRFGKKVASWVWALTKPDGFVRDFSKLKDACPEVKRIKLADRIDNIKKRVYGEHYFYYEYIEETENLLGIIGDGDIQLADLLRSLVEKLREKSAKYEHGNFFQVSRNSYYSKTEDVEGRGGWDSIGD